MYIPRIILIKIENCDKGELVVTLQNNLLSQITNEVTNDLIHKVTHLSENKRRIKYLITKSKWSTQAYNSAKNSLALIQPSSTFSFFEIFPWTD